MQTYQICTNEPYIFIQYPKVTLYYNRSEEFFNREEQQPLSLSQYFGRLYTASAVRSNNSTRICMLFQILFFPKLS